MCPTDTGSADAVDLVRREVEAWATHPALSQLVGMFGEAVPTDLDLAARLAWLDEFSSVWDYRGRARARAGRVHSQDAAGAVRWLIPRLQMPAAQLDQIVALADALGLIGESSPSATDFDYLLVIGGGRYTNRLRVGYARELAAGRRIGHVVLAAASRELMDSEQDAVAAIAPQARTEFDLLAAAAGEALGLDIREVQDHARRRVDRPHRDRAVWRFAADSNEMRVPVTLLETPSPDPDNRRANSADTYTFAAQTVGMDNSTCLLVTGQPVVPYLHFEALRTLVLPFAIRLESAGFGVERYNRLGELDEQHPAKILQEARSAIRSARAVAERLTLQR
ncbi:hypothetical protein [Mycobacterium sp.]|uniref:hypothetical protein n=1 Tax=Mycobacterium sp. TaxID=1785 RepID=UPI000CC6BE77|nr:hypothetical protein [Mycobacterium sp.]MBX9981391.1 hypothetical protein [Mycobacterium gordonae]PJE06466.1 MAG: hypothetical protein CK428_24480 [Mycobacterium sp.]